ncbi:MAG: STAS domain-containing protein [Chloroflexi bacterium]|nr:STAS domain-containing protein [Chloroflexota bacterium]
MEITIKEMNRVDLIEVAGRIDSSNAEELGEALKQRVDDGRRNLVVDLAGVEYMSSAGLRELVATLKQVKQGSGDLRLCNPSERVAEVLELAGLDSVFEIYDDQVTAVGSF